MTRDDFLALLDLDAEIVDRALARYERGDIPVWDACLLVHAIDRASDHVGADAAAWELGIPAYAVAELAALAERCPCVASATR